MWGHSFQHLLRNFSISVKIIFPGGLEGSRKFVREKLLAWSVQEKDKIVLFRHNKLGLASKNQQLYGLQASVNMRGKWEIRNTTLKGKNSIVVYILLKHHTNNSEAGTRHIFLVKNKYVFIPKCPVEMSSQAVP